MANSSIDMYSTDLLYSMFEASVLLDEIDRLVVHSDLSDAIVVIESIKQASK